jgi:hypothetical protein
MRMEYRLKIDFLRLFTATKSKLFSFLKDTDFLSKIFMKFHEMGVHGIDTWASVSGWPEWPITNTRRKSGCACVHVSRRLFTKM